ncbi:hypothetical protein [Rhodohalobacter sp. 8-1]|uniref:hypothetical protein n=1 Tax=Rhodohalobacter sp. 8-1 TaxID=3131972 RepID=UPI0030ED406E
MINKKSYYQPAIIVCLFLSIIIAACDSPSDSFERLNRSDPGSVLFEGEKEGDYDLKLEFDSERNMTLSWGELEDFIDKVVIKKSLGDSLSYSMVAELESPGTEWQDTSGAIDRLIYYKIETYYIRNSVEYKYGEAMLKEQLGEFLDFSFVINNENESLDIRWEVDTPFFDSFVLESDHMINENGDKRVEIPFSTLVTEISIKDPDISFSQRNYTLTGVIEGVNGQEDIVVKRELTADLKSAYKPQNLKVDIIDEQDWLLSWEGAPYFADKVVVRRNGYNSNWYDREFQSNKESLLDTVLSVPETRLVEMNRRYRVLFKDGGFESDTSFIDDWLELTQPELIETPSEDPSNQAITIAWEITGRDVDKIKEFIIEKRIEDDFKEIGRVPADKRQFTYSDLDITKKSIFRVSSLTSNYTLPKTYKYLNDYTRVQTFDTNITEFSATQTTSDNQYFIGLSADGDLLEIWDLTTGEKVHDFQPETGLIGDFKISHDNQYIYYVIPYKRSVFRADFPTLINPTEVIDNAVYPDDDNKMDGYPIQKIALSKDGEFLLGVGADYVKYWSLDNYKKGYTVRYVSSAYNNGFYVDISNDSKTFVTSGSGYFRLMNTSDGSIISTYESDFYITDLRFSPLNNFISVKTGNDTFLYRPESKSMYKQLTGPKFVKFDPKNDNILLIGELVDNYRESYFDIYFYDLATDERIGVLNDKDLERPGFYARYMSYIDSDRIIIGFSEDNTLEIWEKADSKQWKMIR